MHAILFVQLEWLGKRLLPSGQENVVTNMHLVLVRILSANQSEGGDHFFKLSLRTITLELVNVLIANLKIKTVNASIKMNAHVHSGIGLIT